MKNTIYIWKPVGLTPLDTINKFKENFTEYKNETISYAGRLDPMAEGMLILLIGEENKNRSKYLGLKKEYESEIILGIYTDTFDSLGLITDFNFKEISKEEIEKCLKSFLGKQKQFYPPYSSKAVKGKPLFWWARKERLNEIKIPEKEIEIYSTDMMDFEKIKVKNLVDQIQNQIKKIKGDYRQNEIIRSWEKFGIKHRDMELVKIKIKLNCSSGTYVRRIADDLGGFAYTIIRTKIGEMTRNNSTKI